MKVSPLGNNEVTQVAWFPNDPTRADPKPHSILTVMEDRQLQYLKLWTQSAQLS